jgi:hypothetical protein
MSMLVFTTGFEVFAESGIPLGEGPFPLTEAFTESLLSVKASRRTLYRRRTLRREPPRHHPRTPHRERGEAQGPPPTTARHLHRTPPPRSAAAGAGEEAPPPPHTTARHLHRTPLPRSAAAGAGEEAICRRRKHIQTYIHTDIERGGPTAPRLKTRRAAGSSMRRAPGHAAPPGRRGAGVPDMPPLPLAPPLLLTTR